MKNVTIYVVCSVDRYYKVGQGIAELVYMGVKKEVSVVDDHFAKDSSLILDTLILAIEKLKYPCNITIKSNNEYLVKGVKYWLASWERNGWKTKTGSPVSHQRLWKTLSELIKDHKVSAELTKNIPDGLQEKAEKYAIEEGAKKQEVHMFYRDRARTRKGWH